MKTNSTVVKGKWLEIRGEVQKAWGKLTDDELDQAQGDMKAISGLIMQKYGHEKATYKDRLAEIFQRFDEKKDGALRDVKDKLKSNRGNERGRH
jgi:uncharacterized protein YjbJ (UPF0337 family)